MARDGDLESILFEIAGDSELETDLFGVTGKSDQELDLLLRKWLLEWK